MTSRNVGLSMERIYSRAPNGDEYSIELMPVGPEDRGQIGRVRIRAQNGSTEMRDLWWLRCPWCRELVEISLERLNVDAGVVRIDGTIICPHCEAVYEVNAGRARRLHAGAGCEVVTSEPIVASEQ